MRIHIVVLLFSLHGASYAMESISHGEKEALLLACADANCSMFLEALLRNGVNVDTSSSLGNTALHRASYNGYAEQIKLLISFGARVNARNNKGATPLHLAMSSEKPNLKTLEALLANGAQADAPDFNFNTPLHYAARRYSIKSVEKFLKILVLNNAKSLYAETKNRLVYLLWVFKTKALPRDVVHHILSQSVELREDIAIILGCSMLKNGSQTLKAVSGSLLHKIFSVDYVADLLISLYSKELSSLLSKKNRINQKAWHTLPPEKCQLLLSGTVHSELLPIIISSLQNPHSRDFMELPSEQGSLLEDNHIEGRELRKTFFEAFGTFFDQMLPFESREVLEGLIPKEKDVVCVIKY